MADYRLTATDASVIRTADSACIPNDPANRDYADYQQWIANGGVPDPYVPPTPVPPTLNASEQVLYDHENRIRGLEGQSPMSLADFTRKVRK